MISSFGVSLLDCNPFNASFNTVRLYLQTDPTPPHPCCSPALHRRGSGGFGQLSLSFVPAPSGGTCGGFLCDEMGLGKTLQSLMLVHYNPPPPGWALSVAGIRAQAEEAARKAAQEREERYGIPRLASEAPDPVPVRTTLVVVPANLLSQWMDEIELHLLPGAIKWVFLAHRIFVLWTLSGCCLVFL